MTTTTHAVVVPIVSGIHPSGMATIERVPATAVVIDGEQQCIILGPPLIAGRIADLLDQYGVLNIPEGVE